MGMARHSAIEDLSTTASEADGRPPSQDGMRTGACAQRILIGAQLLRGEIDVALAAARQLAGQTGRQDGVDLLVEIALEQGRAQVARSVLAQTEATIPPAQAAQIKARIAVSEGDLEAAKAILVMAIETVGDAAPLRTLLAEVMVAAGTASDARAVLATLGLAPVNPPASDDDGLDDDLAQGAALAQPGKRIG